MDTIEDVVIVGDPFGTDEAYGIEGDAQAQGRRAESRSFDDAVVQSFDLPPAGGSLVIGDVRISAVPVLGGAPFYVISRS